MEQKENYLDFCLLPLLPTLPPAFPARHRALLLSSSPAAFLGTSTSCLEPLSAPCLPQ